VDSGFSASKGEALSPLFAVAPFQTFPSLLKEALVTPALSLDLKRSSEAVLDDFPSSSGRRKLRSSVSLTMSLVIRSTAFSSRVAETAADATSYDRL
jgi:hypothetical protein